MLPESVIHKTPCWPDVANTLAQMDMHEPFASEGEAFEEERRSKNISWVERSETQRLAPSLTWGEIVGFRFALPNLPRCNYYGHDTALNDSLFPYQIVLKPTFETDVPVSARRHVIRFVNKP